MTITTNTTTTTTVFSVAKLQELAELTGLVKHIVALNDIIKEKNALLDKAKKRLAEILPADGFRLQDEIDEGKVIEAKWTDKLTKTLQTALVEQNHGIVLDDADYKITPSHYVSVAKVKAAK